MKQYREKVLVLLFLVFTLTGFAQVKVKQGGPVPATTCVSQMEMSLHKMINDYRNRYGLPPVTLSRSLCFVAATHVRDLYANNPDKSPCNLYSWSDQGTWKPFCYPRDENKKNSVWDKPKELTPYPGKGYEIIYWENSATSIDSIMSFWKSESYFSDFFLNKGKWAEKKWKAIGIAIFENYASVWLGELVDPEGKAFVCGSIPIEKVSDTVVSQRMKGDDKPPTEVAASPGKDKGLGEALPVATQKGFYYIIVKSGLPFPAAEKLVKSLKDEGYPDAKILEKDGKARVSIFESADRNIIMAKLREVKLRYKDAWMLKM